MPILLKYPHIEQYRNVVKYVKMHARYKGKDEAGEPIYDASLPLPKLEFRGGVKLHGTNAAICQDGNGKVWTQSRERLLTPEEDNAGFCKWTEENKAVFAKLFYHLRKTYTMLAKDAILAVYGEWCGEGIQKGVGISHLPKMFVVFSLGFYTSQGEPMDPHWELPDNLKYPFTQPYLANVNIYCIYSFSEHSVTIDFEHPELVQNFLRDRTMAVEQSCPVAFQLNAWRCKKTGDCWEDGIGEGVVWQCITEGWRSSNLWFKVKGEKHSVSHIKTLAAVDIEKVNSIKECVEKIVTEARMLQGLDKLKEQNLEFDIKNMGAFLKWLASDAIREEADTISGSGLEAKEVGKAISDKGRKWFMNKLNNIGEE